MSTILIVGGASGSGGVLARRLIARGDKVVMADHAASQLTRQLQTPDNSFSALDCDPLDLELPERLLAFCHRRAGPPEGLFISTNRSSEIPLSEWSAPLFDGELFANLTIPFFLARTIALDMQINRRGAIIFTASTAGLSGRAGKAPFHAAKAALSGLTRALADELGPYNIRVNCLLPGWIDSPYGRPGQAALPIIPLNRIGEMEDVAMAATFLLTTNYVHGADLVVDGGFTAIGPRPVENKQTTM